MAELAVDSGVAARLLGEAVHHREAEPGSLACGLGREEGLERKLHHLGRHAVAGVADGEHDVLARLHVGVLARVGIVERDVAELDRHPAAALHGVARVDGEVEHRVLDLRRIDEGVPEAGGRHGLDLDRFAERAAQHVAHADDAAGNVDDLGLQRLAPAEGEQLAGQLGAAPDRRFRLAQPLRDLLVAGREPAQQLQVVGDHLQDVVEVVRHAAGELADGVHLLRLAQLLLGSAQDLCTRPLRRQVAADGADEPVARHHRPADPAHAAVLVPAAVLQADRRVALGQAGQRGRTRREVVGVHEIEPAAPDQLLFRPAEDRARRRIDGRDEAVDARHQHDVGREPPEPVAVAGALGDLALEVLVEVRQRRGGGLLVFDVGVGADPARQRAIGAANRHGAGNVPAVRRVGPAQAELGLVELARGDRRGPARRGDRQVFGVDEAGPALAVERPALGAAVFVDAVVEPVEQAVGRCRPDVVRHRLGEGAEQGFAGAQGLFGLLALGDVAAHRDQTVGPAVGAGQRRDDHVPPLRRAVSGGAKTLKAATSSLTRGGDCSTRRCLVGAVPDPQPGVAEQGLDVLEVHGLDAARAHPQRIAFEVENEKAVAAGGEDESADVLRVHLAVNESRDAAARRINSSTRMVRLHADALASGMPAAGSTASAGSR